MQLIDIISKVEGWTHEQVYKTAHKEVNIEGDPWEKFNKSLRPDEGGVLPMPVRFELIRAFDIHYEAGTLKPKHFKTVKVDRDAENPLASFTANKFFKYAMWFWAIYFIVTIFF